MIKLISLGLLFTIGLALQAKAECNLETSLPPQAPRILSNNQAILTPSFAKDLQSIIVFGRMDGDAVTKTLRQNNLYPLQMKYLGKTYAIGALSFFNYRESDLGSFREIYFVVVATKKKMEVLSSIKSIIKALRPSRENQETDLVLFHIKAYSSSETGVLSSREVWNIDSELANIQTRQTDNWLQFDLKTTSGESKVSSFNLDSFIGLPIEGHINLDASGPVFEGKQAFSYILSCSHADYSLFNSKRHHISVDRGLEALFKQFSYRPWFVEHSPRSQAIQFLPRKTTI